MKDLIISVTDLFYTAAGKTLLNISSLSIEKGMTLAVLGANGSGKSLLAGILAGEIPGKGREQRYGSSLAGNIQINGSVELVSFREQALIMEKERYFDDTEFLETEDPGRELKAFICGAPAGSSAIGAKPYIIPGDLLLRGDGLLELFGLTEKADTGLRYLSTGEFRKALLCRSLLEPPDLLVLDDPFSGLDREAVIELKETLKGLHGELSLLILSGKISDIPEWCDGLSNLSEGILTVFPSFKEGQIRWQEIMAEESGHLTLPIAPNASVSAFSGLPSGPGEQDPLHPRCLIKMNSIKVHYRDIPVLTALSWTVRQGEHWQISGPNGSGKSTLLSLITGDNPKAFGQDITLFGRMKGSGETVWEIKQKIGLVSGAFHLGYLMRESVLEVILSGFFDSVGLYEKPDPVQIEKARSWCARLDLEGRENALFGSLSFGLQRSVLIARAVIKEPLLLILDEPCQGLDDAHTAQVLATVGSIGNAGLSTILYVSHREEQKIPSIEQRLTLVPHPAGGFSGKAGPCL